MTTWTSSATIERASDPKFQAYVYWQLIQQPADISLSDLALKCACSQILTKRTMVNLTSKHMLDITRQQLWRARLGINSIQPAATPPPKRELEEIPHYVTKSIYGGKHFRKGMIPVGQRVAALNAFIHARGSILDAAVSSGISSQTIHVIYDDWKFIPHEFLERISEHSHKARRFLDDERVKAEKKEERAARKLEAELEAEGEPQVASLIKPATPLAASETQATADGLRRSEIRSICREEVESALALHTHHSVHQPALNGSSPGIAHALTSPFRFVGRRVWAVGRAVVRG